MSARPTHFVCTPYACTLSVDVCIDRHHMAHAEVERPTGSGGAMAHNLQRSSCRDCTVGERHRAGVAPRLWPDGTPIVRIRSLVRGDGLPPGTLSKEERARREKLGAQLREAQARRKTRASARADRK